MVLAGRGGEHPAKLEVKDCCEDGQEVSMLDGRLIILFFRLDMAKKLCCHLYVFVLFLVYETQFK